MERGMHGRPRPRLPRPKRLTPSRRARVPRNQPAGPRPATPRCRLTPPSSSGPPASCQKLGRRRSRLPPVLRRLAQPWLRRRSAGRHRGQLLRQHALAGRRGGAGRRKSSSQMGARIVRLGVRSGRWPTCRQSSGRRTPHEVRGRRVGRPIEWRALCGGACSLGAWLVCTPLDLSGACTDTQGLKPEGLRA